MNNIPSFREWRKNRLSNCHNCHTVCRKAFFFLCWYWYYHYLCSIVTEAPLWQGTIIYFELHTDREIDPNSILENRTDAETEFNETFIDTSDLDELW